MSSQIRSTLIVGASVAVFVLGAEFTAALLARPRRGTVARQEGLC